MLLKVLKIYGSQLSKTVIIESKGHTAFTCPLLGVIDILTEVIELGVVDLEVVRA
jgi:hypothetical protein